MVRLLDASRRALALVAVQVQLTRSLAARQSRSEDVPDGRMRPDLAPGDEAEYARLLQQFEAGLREAETRRIALHHETEGLRQRKQAALRQLSAPVRSAYEAALQAGRVPAITIVVNGVCSACTSRLPLAVVEASRRGSVVVCSGCARLPCPIEAR